jgi:hypothetical protein
LDRRVDGPQGLVMALSISLSEMFPYYTDLGSTPSAAAAHKSEIPILNIKIKVKLSLCLTKHHAMQTYLGVEG